MGSSPHSSAGDPDRPTERPSDESINFGRMARNLRHSNSSRRGRRREFFRGAPKRMLGAWIHQKLAGEPCSQSGFLDQVLGSKPLQADRAGGSDERDWVNNIMLGAPNNRW